MDWGTQTHRVAVLSDDGRVIEQYDAAHSGEGLVAAICLVPALDGACFS